VRNQRLVPLLPLLVAVMSVGLADKALGRTCCKRDLGMMPVAMPAGQEVDLKNFFESMVIGPLLMPTVDCDCPTIDFYDHDALKEVYERYEKIDAAVRRRDHLPPVPSTSTPPEEVLHYLFVGTLTADHVTGKTKRECDPESPGDCWGGNLEGTFTFHVKLFDQHNKQTLNEGSVSWTGHILFDVGNRVKDLSKSLFLPLDKLIRDYERTPEGARVEVPNNTAQAGDTVSIKISDLRNEEGQPTQEWQRILVKVEKGKILNADSRLSEKEGGYYVFKAGKNAEVNVQYRAPDGCKPDKETLTVFNTCETRPKYEPGAKTELAKKEFNIVCDQWDVTITYTEDLGGTYEAAKGHKITVQRNYSGTFKARVKLIKNDGRTATYESKDAEAQIHDNYNHHSVMEECAWRGGFNGDKSGRVPIEVTFRLNTHNHTYHVGLGKWSGDGTTYTLGGNLFGTLPGCSGAWQQEISSIVLPRGWEKGEGPPSSRTWAPGQTSFTFQTSWDDYMTGIWPQGAPGPPPMLSGMVPAAYRLTYAPAVFDQARFPNMKIKKTLSWEIKRPN
jgi:hypothetical protein